MNNKKKIILICVFIIIAVFFIAESLLLFDSKKIKNNNLLTVEAQKSDKEYYYIAVAQKDYNICSKIKDNQTGDLCFKQLATMTSNVDICGFVRNDVQKKECFDFSMIEMSKNKNNVSMCSQINELMLQKTCVQNNINKGSVSVDICKSLNSEELISFCLSGEYYRMAKADKNSNQCKYIPNPVQRANCLSELSNIDLQSDLDKDDLTFLQEIVNGTNPNIADTDGDGHFDGDEVKNNYNPLGTGTIKDKGRIWEK